jgi:hypothetical protein
LSSVQQKAYCQSIAGGGRTYTSSTTDTGLLTERIPTADPWPQCGWLTQNYQTHICHHHCCHTLCRNWARSPLLRGYSCCHGHIIRVAESWVYITKVTIGNYCVTVTNSQQLCFHDHRILSRTIPLILLSVQHGWTYVDVATIAGPCFWLWDTSGGPYLWLGHKSGDSTS